MLELRDLFAPAVTYLDAATSGLPPRAAREAFAAATAAWADGTLRPAEGDAIVGRGRAAFAALAGVPVETVAIGHQASPFVGQVAAMLEPGAQVLVAEGDFTSLLFPFLEAERRGALSVTAVPLAELPEAIDATTDLVAVSAVQSADGRLADLDALAAAARHHGALTLIDATQACGWLPLDGARFDVVVAAAYKWLLAPRGTAFMAVAEPLWERLPAHAAGWYATESPWDSCYGLPLRQAPDARRFDVSPAWLAWHATTPGLELLVQAGVPAIHAHDVALAARLRAGLGLPETGSAITSADLGPDAPARLDAAGIRCSVRDGRLRLSCHVHNDPADVDRALEVLAG